MFSATLRALSVLFLAALAVAAPNIRAATSGGPRVVIYHDEWIQNSDRQIPHAADLAGFNVLNLSFLMLSGAVDMAQVWAQMSDADRKQIKAEYAAAGISLMVSAFGSTDAPTSAGADPVATANKMAAWVKQYDLDGIDIDYEDFDAVGANLHGAAQWLTTFTKTLRSQLPAGQYLLTHAPVAPWFSAQDGVYKAFDAAAGSLVDWYNVQFYNQGADEYTTCEGLFEKSSSAWPGTSVFELHTVQGVPLNKIVVGKPGVASQAANGFMAPAALAECAAAAVAKGWAAGVMTWEYTPQHVNAGWASAVRAAVWPVAGGGKQNPGAPAPIPTSSKAKTSATSTATTKATTSAASVKTSATIVKTSTTSVKTATTSAKTSTATTSAKTSSVKTSSPKPTSTTATATSTPTTACGTASAWAAAKTYWAGDAISYGGARYTAKWWTVGDRPTESGEWGVWAPSGACAGASNKKGRADAHRKMVRTHKRASH